MKTLFSLCILFIAMQCTAEWWDTWQPSDGLQWQGPTESIVPFSSDAIAWWDNRDVDFTSTTNLVDTWTDRLNGLVITGTTPNRPLLIDVAGFNYLDFVNDQMAMPATFAWDRQDSSLFIVCRRSTANSFTESLWHMGTNSTTDAAYFVGQDYRMFNASSRSTGFSIGDGLTPLMRVAGTGSVVMAMGTELTTVAASAAGSITNGFLGAWNAGIFEFDGDLVSIVAYNRALTSNEYNTVRDYLTTRYGATDRSIDKFRVYEGDSLTEGTQSTDPVYWAYPHQLARLDSAQVKFALVGTGGAQLQNNVAGTRVLTQLSNNSATASRTVVFGFCSNDINNGRSEAQVEADIDSWIANITNATDIVGCTVTPRTDFDAGEETIRLAVNTHILTTAAFDHTVDLAGDTRLDDASDTTYYDPDGVHHNDAGYAVRAELIKVLLDAQGL